MKSLFPFALAALACAGFALGEAYTNPVGCVSIECKANSDTIVGVPLRQSAAFVGSLNGAPNTNTNPAGYAILTLSGTPGLTVNAFANTHYVKFKNTLPTPAAGDGQWFVIDSNTANTLTVNLNGGSIAAVDGAGLEVIKFWTLAELIDPSLSTTNPATTGNAIVASLSQLATTLARRTQILVPNYAAVGTNASASNIFYVNESIWKRSGSGASNYNSFQLWPESYVIIRNPAAVTQSTFHTVTGEVEPGDIGLSLATHQTSSQDSYVCLPRPVDVKLKDLNLGGTSSFVTSLGILNTQTQRRDQLIVFNNAATGFNKSASAIYFYHDGMWKKSGSGNSNFDDDVIPAGAGFIIRKYKSNDGASVIWSNTSPY